jgi:hypothetical protein
MADKDFAISVTAAPQVGAISKKPCYLLSLEGTGKTKVAYFIAFDKPDMQADFVQVKGVYSNGSEEDIVSGFVDMVRGTPKEEIIEIMFPWHRILSIRSLVFNANKPSSLVK